MSILCLFVTCCSKDPQLWEISNLNNNTISVFGHGGMGERYRYPMDSYESLTESLSIGLDGTEMDVRMTADSVLVLYHSEKLEDLTGCTGDVRDKNISEISACKYRSLLNKGLPLITASQFFSGLKNRNDHIFTLECKVSLSDKPAYVATFARAVVKLVKEYEIVNNTFIESFNSDFLKTLSVSEPRLKLFVYTKAHETGLEISRLIPLYGLVMDREYISADQIKEVHRNGLRVTLFNMSTEEENLAAIRMSPDFVQTDNPEYLLKVLKK